MALKHKRNRKHWTDEEIELLTKLYGICSYETLSKKLKRSKSSIENKRRDLKLGRLTEATEYINSNELARALKRSPCAIRLWIEKRGLPATKRVLKLERKFYRISVNEFWKWAKDNNLMDWTKYEIGNLPNEPKWIKEKIKTATKKTRRNWTKTEEALLIFYYNQGFKIREIAEKLDRTFKSIDQRLNDLKVPRKQVQIDWQPQEVNIMLDMIEEEKTLVQVAEELGRTYDSVSYKYLLLKNMSEQISA